MPVQALSPDSAVVSWGDPETIYAEHGRMPPIALFRAMMAGALPHEPAMAMLGVCLTAVEEGTIRLEIVPAPVHLDHAGRMHGGILAAITDTAAGYAIHTRLGLGWTAATLELHQGFVRPVTLATGHIVCIGRVTHLGRRTAVAEADVIDANGDLYVRMGTTMIVRPPPQR